MTSWFLLRTKPHVETDVSRRIEALGIATFLPRMTVTTRAGRYRQQRTVPMFPTYLFVEIDLEASWKALRYTPGVRDFVRAGGVPQPVAAEIVERLRVRTGESGVWTPPPLRYEPGQRLRIEDGPMRGIEVVFERELSASGRVAVLLAEIDLAARIVLSKDALVAA